MTKFSLKKRDTTKTVNKAGGYAFKHSPEMELIVSVLTTFLEDKFYESGNDRMDRIKLLTSMVKPEFLAKLAVLARNEFHLRSVAHILIGELAKTHRGDDLVKRAILKVAERPDDLIEIVAYVGKPIPKQVKRGVRHALLKFNRHQLSKYKNEGKEVKLVDLFNLCHPNPKHATKEQKQAWKDLIEGNLKNKGTWESKLSDAGKDEDDVDGAKKQAWKELVMENKIGYMALLRNLRNISEQSDEATIQKACVLISNRESVLKSKQLPFRFWNAYEQVSNRKMLEAISEALEHSLSNVPHFEGKTLIAVDASGSMNGDPIKKASIFGAALYKSTDADMILYDESVKELKMLAKTPVLALAENIQRNAHGGGTNTSLTFQYAYSKGVKYDRIIILSDNESWQDSGWGGGGTQATYQQYRKINPNVTVYAIDLAGYGTKDVKGEKVFHLAGWSEKIFDFMKWIEKENALVDFVNKVEL